MDLQSWLNKEGRGARSRLQRESGLGWTTIYDLIAGRYLLERFDKAEALHRATRGEVPLSSIWGPAARGEVELAKAVRQ